MIRAVALFALLSLIATPCVAQERLCDASAENCRTQLINLIDHESVGISMGYWFIKDQRYLSALTRAHNRGVPIRLIMDPRADSTYAANKPIETALKNLGIPMRKKVGGDICHWKLVILEGQRVVEWSGANFSPTAFVPEAPYSNYEDEVIYFSHHLFDSFITKFDDIWTSTSGYANYANITGPLLRRYPQMAINAGLNFPPKQSYFARLIPFIDREMVGIDVDMYRQTADAPISALIRALARGVHVRYYTEPNEYANPARPGNKYELDRLAAAGRKYPEGRLEIRMRAHAGLNHQKTVWFRGQRVVVFGTSNWSDASNDNQLEANLFTRDPAIYDGLHAIFWRKWTNATGHVETTDWF